MLSGFDLGALRQDLGRLRRVQPAGFQVDTCRKMRRPPLRSTDPAEKESVPLPPSLPPPILPLLQTSRLLGAAPVCP